MKKYFASEASVRIRMRSFKLFHQIMKISGKRIPAYLTLRRKREADQCG